MRWTAEHMLFAGAIANLAALVHERHQRQMAEAATLASANRLTRQQQALNDLMRDETIRTGDLAQAFRKIAKLLSGELRLDRVGVVLFADGKAHPVHSEIYVTREDWFVVGQNAYVDGYPEPMARAVVDRPLTIEDCINHPLTAPIYDALLRPKDIRSVIHAPILLDGKLAGIVQCTVCGTMRQWQPEDVALATGVANVVALVRERNLRLAIEDDLRTAKGAAEAANRAKSLFLANMSHEVRTPMNGVLGMVDVLSQTELSERQRRLTGMIGQSARTLLAIINDILDVSRIEEGKLHLERHAFELHGCVEDAVAVMAEEAQKNGLELALHIDEAAFAWVDGDAVRLRQVLLNLIGNAIKFTAHGEVSVRVEVERQGESDDCVRFVVADTGIGIDRAAQQRLFQPFMQADGSISRRYGGTGLGLSISRHLVGLMGGSIRIESEPGRGTRVTFELPMTLRLLGPAQAIAMAGIEGREVLVVGERAASRSNVCAYLAAAGARPLPADSAERARALAAEAAGAGRPIPLAIVDHVSSGLDGVELCRQLGATREGDRMRFVLLCSLSWSADRAVLADAGIDRLLTQPIRRLELLATVGELLAGDMVAPELQTAVGSDRIGGRRLGLRVLLAEDNPVNQLVAGEYLANLGCSFATVEDGVQALVALDRERFDIVLMDCQMPRMDGLTATRQFRAREGGAPRLPIVAVTASAYDEDRQACQKAGMQGYLSKPFSQEELAAVLTAMAGAAEPCPATLAEEPATAPVSCERGQSDIELPAWRGPGRPRSQRGALQSFLTTASALVAAMDAALQREDHVGLQLAAHSLGTSSANIGDDDISDQCRRIAQPSAAGDIAECAPLLSALQRAMTAMAAQLEAERVEAPAARAQVG